MLLTATILQKLLGGNCILKGAIDKDLKGFGTLQDADSDQLTWVRPSDKGINQQVIDSKAGGIICNDSTYESLIPYSSERLFVVVDNPHLAFTKLLRAFVQANTHEDKSERIHPTAIVDADAVIGEGVSIGAYSVIDACKIGANTVIGAYVRIFSPVTIGSDCLIREHCSLGGEGFGFATTETGTKLHMPHIGTLHIGNNVQIFPYTNVDRATLGETSIGAYTIIDHYCHIGHNCRIGTRTAITAQVVLAGGCSIGDDCFIGVNSLIKDKVVIGNAVTTGMGAVVTKNIPDNETWIGNPAREISIFNRKAQGM